LARRIVWNQTVLTGNLQDGIFRLLDENAINPENSSRALSSLGYTASLDPLVTVLELDAQYHGESLLDAVTGLCRANNIGFRMPFSGGLYNFQLYAGVDRSLNQTARSPVIFSPEFENLEGSTYYESVEGEANIALVGGEGDGSERVMVVASTSDNEPYDIARKEMFLDASTVSSQTQSGVMSIEEYENLLYGRVFGATVQSTEAGYLYGRDFGLGDIVHTRNEYGLESPMRITEFVISEDSGGSRSYPTFEKI
jgi:hypothetical protein